MSCRAQSRGPTYFTLPACNLTLTMSTVEDKDWRQRTSAGLETRNVQGCPTTTCAHPATVPASSSLPIEAVAAAGGRAASGERGSRDATETEEEVISVTALEICP